MLELFFENSEQADAYLLSSSCQYQQGVDKNGLYRLKAYLVMRLLQSFFEKICKIEGRGFILTVLEISHRQLFTYLLIIRVADHLKQWLFST